jgi:hypothetical protein
MFGGFCLYAVGKGSGKKEMSSFICTDADTQNQRQ